MLQFLLNPPRFLFFTGKGGVGKTSVACASAVKLAGLGQKVLLVSTDPASNVSQVLGLTIGNTITPIPAVEGLFALEIDPEQAANAYRERIIAPVRDLLPAQEIASITEQLSGSCTTEVASFNEFTALLADDDAFAMYDHVVFDTAPTGHTIRLLQLPGSWTDFLNEGKGDASCLGPLAGLEKQRTVYADAVAALKDPSRTRLILVSRAQSAALSEVARTNAELNQAGISATHLIVNAVLPASAGTEDLAAAIRMREGIALESMPDGLRTLKLDIIELKASNMIGLQALRHLFDGTDEQLPDLPERGIHFDVREHHLSDLVDEIERSGSGLVMCMGKGGVGKTTIAAAIAVGLARKGHQVHLSTTDPAAHVEETVQGAVNQLRISRIDPQEATRIYRERIMATKGKNLDEAGRAALREDLLSPCTEEVAVFGQFSHLISASRHEFVVIDTAPTGHTLLLLDAAGSYHREIARQMESGTSFRTPMMMLQDPEQTKVILVTVPEPTPVTEARVLQEDLQRAGIQPWAWVINASLAAANPQSAFLRNRAASEVEQINVVESLTKRVALVPLLPEEPTGESHLAAIAEHATSGLR